MPEPRFIRDPIGEEEGIPLFSQVDDYILNYETIAKDHLDYVQSAGDSPFMDSAHINEVDTKTRDFIAVHSAEVQSVLDVGVGLGGLIAPLEIPEKFGVDISMEYLAQAQTRNIRVAMSKVEELPYAPGQFDLVTCTDVLEHVFDYMRCIFQIGRVTKPGGTVVIRVPYKENLDVYRESPQYDFVHVRNFDLSGLRLHFEGLLGFEYLGHCLMGTAYRGWKTSIFEDLILNRDQLETWTARAEAAGATRAAALINAAQFDVEDVMNDLSINAPDLFAQAVAALNRPVEICVAFRCPNDPEVIAQAPLAQTYRALMETGTTSEQRAAAPAVPDAAARQIAVLDMQLKSLKTAVQNQNKTLNSQLAALTQCTNVGLSQLGAQIAGVLTGQNSTLNTLTAQQETLAQQLQTLEQGQRSLVQAQNALAQDQHVLAQHQAQMARSLTTRVKDSLRRLRGTLPPRS